MLTYTILLMMAVGQGSSERTWDFQYPKSSAGSVLDLRYLNEPVAGEAGYVRVAADGIGFVRGDGKAIRFWPVCAFAYRLPPEKLSEHARFLARMGVNMVRLHASISPKGKGRTLTEVDTEEIDRIQRYVAAVKKEGIYVTLSPFWANGGHSGAAASWGLGYGDGEDIWGLLFFNPKLQEAYKTWCRKLYLSANPYTGVPLAKDPAVAIAQVQNEDSLLFWTFQGIKPTQKAILSERFSGWLVRKYGSAANVKQRWGDAWRSEDQTAPAFRPSLLGTWELTQPAAGGMRSRTNDQMAFLIDLQRGFYADMVKFYRLELGYKGLLNACNWISADAVRMNDAERYTYTPMEVVAVNRYTNGGVHKGPNDGWRIDDGDFFTNRSALLDPRSLPFNVKQVVGHPTIITEGGWVLPLEYQAEGPILAAAYQSLNGMQGHYWFALDEAGYDADATFPFITTQGVNHPTRKWTQATPQTLGQFPAAALIYRQGMIQRAPVVVHEVRTRADLDQRTIPLLAEDPSFDPNHTGGDARAGKAEAKGVDPLAFLVGRVEVAYDGNATQTRITPLTARNLPGEKRVQSLTGELNLDYGTGLFRFESDQAQGVVGFLRRAGGDFSLRDIRVRSGAEYAAISVVAMDNLALRTSRRVLVQVGTVAHLSGWRQSPETRDGQTGFRVDSTGHMPWQVRRVPLTVSIANPKLRTARVLDPAGVPRQRITGRVVGNRVEFQLTEDAMYFILE